MIMMMMIPYTVLACDYQGIWVQGSCLLFLFFYGRTVLPESMSYRDAPVSIHTVSLSKLYTVVILSY